MWLRPKQEFWLRLKSVEVAKLDFYPNVSLGFFSGYNTLKISQLTQNLSAQYGVAPKS
jgi:outer membrane protein TolC